MKRCHRLRDTSTDPYQEFSFEKSLRKYEKTPTKKVKMDHLHHHRNALHPIKLSQFMHQHHFVEKEEEEAVAVERQQGKEENKIENEDVDNEAIGDVLIEELKEREGGEVEGEIVKESPTVSKEVSTEQMPAKQETHSLAAEELHQHQQPLPTPSTKNTIQCTNLVSGGRFHLNNHIFISQRSLERMGKRHGEEKIVEELLRKRSYLQSQRDAIASRLRELMKNQ